MIKILNELICDLGNLFNLTKGQQFTHDYLTIISATIIVSLLWVSLSYLIYLRTDKNLNLYSGKYTLVGICIETLIPIFTNIVLYWFLLLTISIVGIFIFTISWQKIFLRFIGGQNSDIKNLINVFNKLATNNQHSD